MNSTGAAESKSAGVRGFWARLCGGPGLLALSVVLLDQLTKWLTVWKWPRPFGEGDEVWVIPGFFRLVHWRNLGAAWSILEGRMGLLTVISAVAAVLLAVFFHRLTEGKARYAIPCGCLLGGVVGNLIDRAFYREGVIDFLRFEFGSYGFPAFNVADSAITCSVIFWVVCAFYTEMQERKAKD